MPEYSPGRRIAFAVELNGKKLCTAGLDGKPGVTSVILTHLLLKDPDDNSIKLGIAGLDSTTQEHLEWALRDLQRGDEIRIQVADDVKPTRLKRRSPVRAGLSHEQMVKNVRTSARSLGYRLVKLRGE